MERFPQDFFYLFSVTKRKYHYRSPLDLAKYVFRWKFMLLIQNTYTVLFTSPYTILGLGHLFYFYRSVVRCIQEKHNIFIIFQPIPTQLSKLMVRSLILYDSATERKQIFQDLAFLLALKVPIIQPGGNFCLKVGMKRAINPWYKTEGKIALAKLTLRTHTY